MKKACTCITWLSSTWTYREKGTNEIFTRAFRNTNDPGRGEGEGGTPNGNGRGCSSEISKMTPKRYLSHTKMRLRNKIFTRKMMFIRL